MNDCILVVDDERDSCEVIQRVLEFHGIPSVAAASAEEALHTLESITPTAIIVDLALPGMDGWSLLKTLKRQISYAHIPLIAITAYHSFEVAEKAIEIGFDAYFSKPVDARSFANDLMNLLAPE